jgi:hydroxyquinol 1,2-dioxygenase
MRNLDENTITEEAIRRLENCKDARFKEIMTSLTRHLHEFAREVKLTEAEWMQGLEYLTAVGQKCDDKRQEFILLSDTLGLSMLVVALNNRKPEGCTEATVFGPFHTDKASDFNNGDDLAKGVTGQPAFISGTVRGQDGKPIAGAVIDVWQADGDGIYDVQYTDKDGALFARGRLKSDANGKYWFRSVLPEFYSIPTDGPVGEWIRRGGRHPFRPAHLHFMLQAPGYEKLVTHVFRSDDQYLDSDAVFGVRSSLISDWVRHEPGTAPDGTKMDKPYYTLDFDFILPPLKKAA